MLLTWEIFIILLFIVLFIVGCFKSENMFGFSIVLLVFIIGGLLPSVNNDIDTPILSLERGTEISGFVLGFGKIEEKIVYYAYQKVGDNRFKLITIPQTEIQETDKVKPSYKKITKCERPYLFSRCKVVDDTIYVPIGTIQKNFNP